MLPDSRLFTKICIILPLINRYQAASLTKKINYSHLLLLSQFYLLDQINKDGCRLSVSHLTDWEDPSKQQTAETVE